MKTEVKNSASMVIGEDVIRDVLKRINKTSECCVNGHGASVYRIQLTGSEMARKVAHALNELVRYQVTVSFRERINADVAMAVREYTETHGSTPPLNLLRPYFFVMNDRNLYLATRLPKAEVIQSIEEAIGHPERCNEHRLNLLKLPGYPYVPHSALRWN